MNKLLFAPRPDELLQFSQIQQRFAFDVLRHMGTAQINFLRMQVCVAEACTGNLQRMFDKLGNEMPTGIDTSIDGGGPREPDLSEQVTAVVPYRPMEQ